MKKLLGIVVLSLILLVNPITIKHSYAYWDWATDLWTVVGVVTQDNLSRTKEERAKYKRCFKLYRSQGDSYLEARKKAKLCKK